MITKGEVENGSRNGIWSFYYPTSHLHFQGNFQQDFKEGEWTYYDEKGNIVTKASFVKGQTEGSKTYFDRNGNPVAKEFYEGGKHTGLTEFFSADGLLKARLQTGSAIRNFQAYHSNGNLRFETIDWKNKKNDTTHVFYDNGNTKESLIFYKNILLSIGTTYDKDGNAVDNGTFKDGAGKVIRYYDDMKPFSVCMYSAGLKSGIGQSYYPNGQIKEAGLYSKGFKTGVWKYYEENGELKTSIEHRGEIEDREFISEFSPDGLEVQKLASVAEFPGGYKSFNRYLRDQFAAIEVDKGTRVTLAVDLDEYGFSKGMKVVSNSAELSESLQKAINSFPRCIPAFEEGVPVESSLVQVYRF